MRNVRFTSDSRQRPLPFSTSNPRVASWNAFTTAFLLLPSTPPQTRLSHSLHPVRRPVCHKKCNLLFSPPSVRLRAGGRMKGRGAFFRYTSQALEECLTWFVFCVLSNLTAFCWRSRVQLIISYLQARRASKGQHSQ